jgi:hypothetical protein
MLTEIVVNRLSRTAPMREKPRTRLVREGEYVVEVEMELVYTDDGWSPYLSLADAEKLNEVRDALRRGDFKRAAKYGRVYSLIPIAL